MRPDDLELKSVRLNSRQLNDLELILNGGFSPLSGFLDYENYDTVLKSLRLTSGALWPIPVTLDTDDISGINEGAEILLCDEYNKPLAKLFVTSIYEPNKRKEAELVYGTTDLFHYGVKYLYSRTGKYYLGGRVSKINDIIHYDFTNYRKSPRELKKIIAEYGWKNVAGFQTRNPIHKAHYFLMKRAADDYSAMILLHPSVGVTKDDDIDYVTRTKCYISVFEKYLRHTAFFSLLPLAMRMAGPREALWHTLIRKNYGCTHFIIGKDQASPGVDKDGRPYYSQYDAHDLINRYKNEIKITPIYFDEVVYVENKKKYFFTKDLEKDDNVLNISGTKFRKMVRENNPVPEWFAFPEVVKILRNTAGKRLGVTIFFTGLASSGKSTLSRLLYYRLLEIQSRNISIFDGDIVRANLSKGLGFNKEDRIENIKRIGFVANEVTKHGGIAICAAIAPYEEARLYNRNMIEKIGSYVEVYLSTPIQTCVERDVKGLYRKAKAGKLPNMTGVGGDYEIPLNADIDLDTSRISEEQCLNVIIDFLRKKGII